MKVNSIVISVSIVVSLVSGGVLIYSCMLKFFVVRYSLMIVSNSGSEFSSV